MKKKLNEHLLSILFVSVILLLLLFLFGSKKDKTQAKNRAEVEAYLDLDFIDFDNPFHKALLHDALHLYYPSQPQKNDSLLAAIEIARSEQLRNYLHQTPGRESLNFSKFIDLMAMYIKFIFIYGAVLLFTYYAVQTVAVLRFVRKKRQRASYLYELVKSIGVLPNKQQPKAVLNYFADNFLIAAKAVSKGVAYLILFSPAYVIAYSLKTDFSAGAVFFMIGFGVISNGLLITYSNKFYSFLVAESRKGYVQTAIVKNLKNSYDPHEPDGISYKSIFRLNKSFSGHVFNHIFMNARYQYIATLKEQASFLISGLIIIEMALNIHDHLSYELLQQLLYGNRDSVIVIILGIFYIVKGTEMITDYLIDRAAQKIANAPAGEQ